MPMYYSLETGGFYDTDFAKYKLPQDAVEISKEQYRQLKSGIFSNKFVSISQEGHFVFSDKKMTFEEETNTEILWIDLELNRARDELEKVQDSDPKATGSVSDWRAYRKSLRAWPENQNFPNKEFRPKAPDAE